MEKTYFTLEQANALLPFLTERLEGMQRAKEEIIRLVEKMTEDGLDVEHILSATSLPPQHESYRKKFDSFGDEVEDLMFEIQEKGVLVKDIEEGLVDFFAKIDGEDVFLCWKLGEPEVQFWHSLKEGFDGRQSLFERSILENVTNVH